MSTALGGGTKDLKNHSLSTKWCEKYSAQNLSCFTAFSQEVSSHMENTSLWAPAVRTQVLISTARRRGASFAGYLKQRPTAYSLACVAVERFGLGIRCVMLRSNYLLSWKARSLGRKRFRALHHGRTRKEERLAAQPRSSHRQSGPAGEIVAAQAIS